MSYDILWTVLRSTAALTANCFIAMKNWVLRNAAARDADGICRSLTACDGHMKRI